MTGFYVHVKGSHYYKCQKKCKGSSLSAHKLHLSFKELLSEYQFDLKKLDSIVPEIMKYKLIEMSKSDANEVAVAKTKLTQVKKELDTIEERYATGKIDTLIHTKFSEKYKTEISDLEEKLMNPNLTS